MQIHPIDASQYKERAASTLAGDLPFGRVFTPHLAVLRFDRKEGWHDGKIVVREPFLLDPAAMCLHYGQCGFEGLKAHRQDRGDVVLFRPDQHAQRLRRTCESLSIPPVPEADFLAATEALVTTDYAWVPEREGTSLYLRPTIIATEAALGVRPADEYLFYVLANATGPYFASGFSGIRVAVERERSRVPRGGLGSAKAGANYIASMFAAARAKERGCAQVLWLDACEHRWVEETGASNVFWVEGDTLLTPPLSDTILKGVTRDCLLQIAPRLGLKAREQRLALDDLLSGIRDGRITEFFGSGTAAVVTPISALEVDGEEVQVGAGTPGHVARKLLAAITDIHRGRSDDPYRWCRLVPHPSWA